MRRPARYPGWNPFMNGDVIHGYAGGAFGRDSYACRYVIATGREEVPWIVTCQFDAPFPEFTTHVRTAYENRDSRDYCSCGEFRDDDVEGQP